MGDTATKASVLKGGEFIINDAYAADIFIPEDFNEEQRMVQQMVKDFIKEAGEKAGKFEHQVALMEKAGELGLLGAQRVWWHVDGQQYGQHHL